MFLINGHKLEKILKLAITMLWQNSEFILWKNYVFQEAHRRFIKLLLNTNFIL